MENQYSRLELLYGQEAVSLLHTKKVCVFGIGGVGGHTVDALVRSGIGAITLIDNDKVSLSNINRQLIATHSTVGQNKVDVMKDHLLEINPEVDVTTYKTFALPDNLSTFNLKDYDYVVDAIDTISTKIALAQYCENNNISLISAMGAGNKIDPTAFEVADIYKTTMCPLAKVMRHELKKCGVKHLKVVYSKEQSRAPLVQEDEDKIAGRRSIPGSNAFTPSVCGLIIASVVINTLTGINDKV